MNIKKEILDIIVQYLNKISSGSNVELSINFNATKEFEDGWIVHYQSKDYLDSGNEKSRLIGTAPFIIDKSTHKIWQLGFRFSPEEYIYLYMKYKSDLRFINAIFSNGDFGGEDLSMQQRCIDAISEMHEHFNSGCVQ